jgi:hypothetical protein
MRRAASPDVTAMRERERERERETERETHTHTHTSRVWRAPEEAPEEKKAPRSASFESDASRPGSITSLGLLASHVLCTLIK